MRWTGGRKSDNIEDRRGFRLTGGRVKGGGIGIVLLALVGMYFGIDPSLILNGNLGESGSSQNSASRVSRQNPAEDKLVDFVSVVLADTEDTWEKLFQEAGGKYEKPKLVLFTGEVRSACGFAESATGPFYCPADKKVYIDLAFYQDLKQNLKAPGDFAQAYVIAHEIGHHVQNLLGISKKKSRRKRPVCPRWNITSCRLNWNCRPIVLPGSGPIMPTACETSLSRAMWKKPSMRQA